jgi:hypothetical protein
LKILKKNLTEVKIMSKKSPTGGIISLFLVFIFVVCGSIYALGMYSEHSQAVDLNNTSSSAVYQAQQEERNVTFTIWSLFEVFLGVGILVATLAAWRNYF